MSKEIEKIKELDKESFEVAFEQSPLGLSIIVKVEILCLMLYRSQLRRNCSTQYPNN